VGRKTAVTAWLGVSLVGLIVVIIVLGLGLFPRLTAAQEVINDARPAFTAERVAADRAAIDMISVAANTVDPIMTPTGGVAAEWPKLRALVAQQSGLSVPQLQARLDTNFPHTAGLLNAVPLSAVSAEIPKLVQFLSVTLKISPTQVLAAIKKNFPHLYQAITKLPTVTSGWNKVPKLTLTRFDGTPVTSVPQIRDYFSRDVIAMLERQQDNFRALDTKGGVRFLAPLLLILGIIVIIFGAALAYGAAKGIPREVDALGWIVVTVVGILVISLVFALSLFPRLRGGHNLLNDARATFNAERVVGDRTAIDMVATVIDVADPIVTPQGGAASEVPKLVAFVSQQAHLPRPVVLSMLKSKFPHTTGLLNAIPLSAVTAELPKLVVFVGKAVKITPKQVLEVIRVNAPKLYQAITNLPTVTSGWNKVPKLTLTRFDGTPVTTMEGVSGYFSKDVVPVVERQQQNFERVDNPWPPLIVFPPLLVIVGGLVVLYGLFCYYLTRKAVL